MATQAVPPQIAQDPLYQQMLVANRSLPPGTNFLSPAYQPIVRLQQQLNQKYASILPNGWGVQPDGVLRQDAFMNRHVQALTALSMLPAGIGIAQGLQAGDLFGPAAGSAGSTGAAGTLPSTATVGSTGALAPGVAPTTDIAAGTTTAAGSGGGGILGSLGKYGGVLGDLGGVLTNASSADANARRADAANNARGIAENNAAKVQAAQFNLGLPSVRTNQVARGEVLNTMQNAPLTGDPRIDKFSGGGLRPSAFGPQSRQAGQLLANTAMNGLQNPSQDRLTPQEIPPYQPSTLDNIGAGAGLGLDIFSLLSKYGGGMNNGAR